MTGERVERTIATSALGRVEGEGGLHVVIEDGEVRQVELRIYEPPRFFEAFLRGRSHLEPPDLTARICGICPVAYQMSACLAIEDACGVEVTGPLDELRRLLYWGEWIESHALHIHLLHAPDLLGVASGIELAGIDRPAVERGLRLKQLGNRVVELLGGRPVHPVNVKVGGWYRLPTSEELREIGEAMRRARDLAHEVVDWVAGLDRPVLEPEHAHLALRSANDYAVLHGEIATSWGETFSAQRFGDEVEEYQVTHSTALHARHRERGPYLVGPLARYGLSSDGLSPSAEAAARSAGLGAVCTNPFDSIVVRAVEVLHACDDAIGIVDSYREPATASVPVTPRAGVGHGATEAPRGLLHHRYELDADGTIVDARIVPPTAQNQPVIEADLHHVIAGHVDLPDDDLRTLAEHAIRNHDPCISCATHFLDLRVDRS